MAKTAPFLGSFQFFSFFFFPPLPSRFPSTSYNSKHFRKVPYHLIHEDLEAVFVLVLHAALPDVNS